MMSDATMDVYSVNIQRANVEILPGVTTEVMAYNGLFPGPTIRTRTNRRVMVMFNNRLDMAANVHLHGGHVTPGNDGHPTDLIQPGQSKVNEYPNRQLGSTLWYHDHAHHMEAEHVYRGLQGFYLIDGADEASMNLPSGACDVPIALRDAAFDDKGQLYWDLFDTESRTTLIANGKAQPFFPVATKKYRFRFLNASTLREFKLNLGGVPMVQIASDGGFLPGPVALTEVLLGPAERAEVVIDFGRFPVGTKLILQDAYGGPVLRFDVVRLASDTSTIPSRLRPLPVFPAPTVNRDVALGLIPGVGFHINGQLFDPNRVDFTVRRGTTEIWTVRNEDVELGIPHTFHLHLVQFQVLDRDGAKPPPSEWGLKDTVLIDPGKSIRIKANFTDYVGRYVYHCHMLEHSELGMMAQMEIVP
jgi:spore coat protein A, manganese oxidase